MVCHYGVMVLCGVQAPNAELASCGADRDAHVDRRRLDDGQNHLQPLCSRSARCAARCTERARRSSK